MIPKQNSAPVAVAVPAPRQTVLWIIALLLAVIATCLLTWRMDGLTAQPAFGQTPMAGARGVFAFTGELDRNRTGLFMLDVDTSNVWVYEYLPARGTLRLVAARSFLYDRHLTEYANEEPLPEQVRVMLRKQTQAMNRHQGADETGLGASIPTVPVTEDLPQKKDDKNP